MKFLFWTNIPNHYQQKFFDSLFKLNVDFKVLYYEKVHYERIKLGWDQFTTLPHNQLYVEKKISSIKVIDDWKERIHILPGYGNIFLIKLVNYLSNNSVKWIHWSEPSHPGFRRGINWPIKRWYARMVNKYALGSFGIGQNAINDFKNWGINVEKIGLLPYSGGLEIDNREKDTICEKFKNNRNAFIYVGFLNHRKGIDLLIKSFENISKLTNDFVLILVGSDLSGGNYQNLVNKFKLNNRILFRGPVNPRDLYSVLSSGDIFILPSRMDGWGVVLNEALSVGKPLIATDKCGAAFHLIEPALNGYRVKSNDVASLTNAMKNYVKNKSLICSHGEYSQIIYQRFTPNENAKKFLAIVQSWI